VGKSRLDRIWSVHPTTDSSSFCQSGPTTRALQYRTRRRRSWLQCGYGSNGRIRQRCECSNQPSRIPFLQCTSYMPIRARHPYYGSHIKSEYDHSSLRNLGMCHSHNMFANYDSVLLAWINRSWLQITHTPNFAVVGLLFTV
jgi:hypothetical protein